MRQSNWNARARTNCKNRDRSRLVKGLTQIPFKAPIRRDPFAIIGSRFGIVGIMSLRTNAVFFPAFAQGRSLCGSPARPIMAGTGGRAPGRPQVPSIFFQAPTQLLKARVLAKRNASLQAPKFVGALD